MTIVLRSLVVRSGSTTLVDGVDLRLTPGSRTALVGASGAGKSLTCAALAGTLPAGLEASGSLHVEPDSVGSSAGFSAGSHAASGQGDGGEGVNLLGLPAARRPRSVRIALVSQDHSTSLHPLIPVGRQIALAARTGGCRAGQGRRRAEEMLRAVGLETSLGERVPGRLSGGQRQRVAIALALVCRPDVLIADEPTTALDVIARAEILELLTRLTADDAGEAERARGADGAGADRDRRAPALLLITHDLPAATICDNVVVLHDGAVVERGPASRVLTRPEHPATVAMCEAAAGETIDGALAAVRTTEASHPGHKGPAGIAA